MIYIIDNGEPPMDHSLYFIEVSEFEQNLFGKALEPILLSQRSYLSQPFIAGVASDIQWRKSCEESFMHFVYLRNLFETDRNGWILGRKSNIPFLSQDAIAYLIRHHIQSFPHDKERFESRQGNNKSYAEIWEILSKP